MAGNARAACGGTGAARARRAIRRCAIHTDFGAGRRPGAPRPRTALSARPRHAPRRPHRVVVCHGLGGRTCRAAPRLAAHLLPQPDLPGRKPDQPLRAAPPALRTRRRHRPGCRAPPPRPAHRTLERRPGQRRRPRCAARRRSAHRPLDARARRPTLALAAAGQRLHAGPHARTYAARAAAGRRRLLAQGARPKPGQPLLQRTAAGRRRGDHARRRAAAPGRPRLAGPRVERPDPAPRRRGLGLVRHQPVRRQRADRLRAAPARRQRPVGRRQLPRGRRRGRTQLHPRRGALQAWPALAQSGHRRELSRAVDAADPGGPAHDQRAARCAGDGVFRRHRHHLLGRPERTAGRRRAPHRPGLPGDDGLRRPLAAGRCRSALRRYGRGARRS
jgi:hypothetical protein